MTAIYKEVEIDYNNKIYACKGTFKFINKFETKGGNLISFEESCAASKPKISDVALWLYSALVTHGCECTFESVGEWVMDNVSYALSKTGELLIATRKIATEEDLENAGNSEADKKKLPQ